METLTVTSASATRNNFQSNSIVPLIKVKTTGFAAAAAESTDVPTPVMTVGHKLLCFTCKKPTELRVLDRIQAQKVDLTLTFNASFVATVVVDHIFAAAGETFVALVEAGTHPDGSITATQKQLITLDDTVRGIASGANGSLVVLGSNGTITQIDANGTTRKTQLPALKPGTAVKSSIVVTHKDAALAVVPGKGTGLDVISLNSDKSVLSKPWVPHGEDTPTFAHVFQTRTFDASSSSNTKYILTAANKNTELRFWALNSEDKSMNLLQQLTVALDESVAAEDAADGSPTTTAAAATVDDRQITISADEEYILLGSRVVPSIVVIELNRQVFKPSRFTDWNATGNVACFVPFTRKLQEGKNISIDLAAVVRTSDTILMATFDAARLVGASNIAATTAASASSGAVASSSSGVNVGASTTAASSGAASTAALGNRQNSVSKWFGQDSATPTIGGAPSSASSAAAANAIPTSVSSSISGRFTSGAGDVQFVTVQAVNAIKGQAGRFREALSAIDEQIVTLQKQASHAIKTLQDAKAKDDAQLAGREFALRNKHRLAQGNAGTSNAAANALTPQQLELMHGLRNFVDSLAPSVREASSDTCRKLLANNLPNAIARAMQAADTADQDVSLPDLKVSHSMQQFGIAIDKLHQSQNNFLKTERNATEALSQRLTQGTDRINRTIASSKAYMSQLVQELSGLRHDVEDAKKVVRTGGRSSVAAAGGAGSGAANQPSLEQIIEESLQLAQAGRWSDAVTKVERTGELSALMHFLLASEQYADVIVSVSNLSLTLVVQVCYRLALDLKSQVGNVPMRCKWLHDFLVEWDDTLQTKASDPKAFGLIREQLEVILDNLGQVDLRRDIDRKTKNEITLSKKILNSVL